MSFFKRRKKRKQLKALLHHARIVRLSREDLMRSEDVEYLQGHYQRAREAYKSGDIEAMEREGGELEQCVGVLAPDRPLAAWRENFDVLVVAISVAMAFRAYFYQPFKIPTGSMQPTLYGIHAVPKRATEAGVMDRQPLKFVKWLITGESFKVVRAKGRGAVQIMAGAQGGRPGYTTVVVGGYPHYVPNDVVHVKNGIYTLDGGLSNGDMVREGGVIWSGVVTSGDFVFVNRWKWNFCHPKRGEIMVFSTNGIGELPQGTHYIKRMVGLPGERLEIRAPDMLVDGEAIYEPLRIGQIARKEKMADWAPAYSGFNPGGLSQSEQSLVKNGDMVELGGDQYYALGDNSFNSADSRYWGSVPERNLLGPATVVYWPLTSPRLGRIL